MGRIFGIQQFLKYLNTDGFRSDRVYAGRYDEQKGIRLQSPPVAIDVYILALKTDPGVVPPDPGVSDSYAYLDHPDNAGVVGILW